MQEGLWCAVECKKKNKIKQIQLPLQGEPTPQIETSWSGHIARRKFSQGSRVMGLKGNWGKKWKLQWKSLGYTVKMRVRTFPALTWIWMQTDDCHCCPLGGFKSSRKISKSQHSTSEQRIGPAGAPAESFGFSVGLTVPYQSEGFSIIPAFGCSGGTQTTSKALARSDISK